VLLVQQRRTVHQGLLVQQLMQQPGRLLAHAGGSCGRM